MRLGRLIAWAAACATVACGGAPSTQGPRAARAGTCDVSATWEGSAVDPSGVPWKVLLVLQHDGASVIGTAEWIAEGGRHVEDLTGAVDCAAGVVTLRAPEGVATYRLELSADDQAVAGRWDTGAGRPGTLEARRKAQK